MTTGMTQNKLHQRSTASSRLFIFAICLLFRYFNAYFTRTYDNPDEYWQGQEVAHNLVFGNGYLTWEWKEKIRSFAHPISFALIYKLVQILGLEQSRVLIWAPRYFQATLTAMADCATYALAKKVIGNEIALPILFTTLCSWFNFFMAARTLSNSMEMVFTVFALYFWPLPGVVNTTVSTGWVKNYRISLILASFACVMRPTNGLIWLFLGLNLIFTSGNKIKVILNASIICGIVVFLNCLLDTRLFNHGFVDQLVFTPYLFFKINVVNNISLFYGVHTWHWYLSQGIPVIFTTFLPLIAYGLYRIYNFKFLLNRIKSLLYLTIWILVVYSLLPHKEFRFIFPIVPIILIISAYGLQQSKKWHKYAIIALFLTQIPMALYLSIWHQRGVMDVMLWIRDEVRQSNNNLSVGVLMPCHSTPWYSIVHENIPMWFLTCEPPLTSSEEYLDEADKFYADPVTFLKAHQEDRVWPTTHLILFDNLLPVLGDYLNDQGYKQCKRFFNSHFHDDSRRRGDVVVFCHDTKN